MLGTVRTQPDIVELAAVGTETSGPFPAEGLPSAVNTGWRYFQEENILKRPCHPDRNWRGV